MSEREEIESFDEYHLNWEELQSLPKDQRAALGVACFAVSEVNALLRIYQFSNVKTTKIPAIDSAVLIQNFVILRTLSAKVFEFSEFIKFKGKHRTADTVLLDIREEALASFAYLRDSEGYRSAQYLRNEAANHYRLEPARKNLDYVHDDADCTIYLHKHAGNCFYPLGEEIMFLGRLNRQGKHLRKLEERAELAEKWLDWSVSAIEWMNDIFLKLVENIVQPSFPEKKSCKVGYKISSQLVGVPGMIVTPLFVRKDGSGAANFK